MRSTPGSEVYYDLGAIHDIRLGTDHASTIRG